MRHDERAGTVAWVVDGIDRERFDAIARQHADALYAKYLDLELWIGINLDRIYALGLQSSPPRRVLDIGAGAGYFLHVCQRMGHRAIGIDLPDRHPMYRDLTELLDVTVVGARVTPYVPLPVDGIFDVISAYMVTFNGHNKDPWGVGEWEFFLTDLSRKLAPGGTVVLHLNNEAATGTCYTPELEAWFRGQGATIDEHRLTLRRP